MGAGDYDQRIGIEAPVKSRGAMGGHQLAWSAPVPRWAEITPGSGSEPEQNGKVVAVHGYTIKMRLMRALTTEHRIIWGDRTLEITSVSHPPRTGETHATATETA